LETLARLETLAPMEIRAQLVLLELEQQARLAQPAQVRTLQQLTAVLLILHLPTTLTEEMVYNGNSNSIKKRHGG
jgi:hypothetical protein